MTARMPQATSRASSAESPTDDATSQYVQVTTGLQEENEVEPLMEGNCLFSPVSSPRRSGDTTDGKVRGQKGVPSRARCSGRETLARTRRSIQQKVFKPCEDYLQVLRLPDPGAMAEEAMKIDARLSQPLEIASTQSLEDLRDARRQRHNPLGRRADINGRAMRVRELNGIDGKCHCTRPPP